MIKIFPLRIIPDVTNINFVKLNKISYGFSILLILASIFCIFTKGFNFGIDFIGGINIEIKTSKYPDLGKMRSTLSSLGIGEVTLQTFGSKNDLSIRVSGDQKEDLMKNVELIKNQLLQDFTENRITFRKIDFVGPQVGKTLVYSGIKAICLAFLAIMLYVWVRFEWQFGLGVVLTLVHDAICCLGFMSLMQLDLNQASIAGILTIIGYSVNDSVVIYDRIRDNLKKYHSKTISEIINLSINQTLSRTTLTIITTLLANLALVLFGGEAIYSFSMLVFFGIIVGTYSSIFISASLLEVFRLESYREKRNIIK